MYHSKIEATEIFQALAERTRLRIMRVMVALPREEACLCDMTDGLLELEHNVSRHLKILRQVGLLSACKEGRWVYHRLVNSPQIGPFYKVIARLTDTDGSFAADLKRFRSELEKRAAIRCTKDGPRFKSEKAKSGG